MVGLPARGKSLIAGKGRFPIPLFHNAAPLTDFVV